MNRIAWVILLLAGCGDGARLPSDGPPPVLSSLCPVVEGAPLPVGSCTMDPTALFVDDFNDGVLDDVWTVPAPARTRFDICDGELVSGSGSRYPGGAELVTTVQTFTPPYAIELDHGASAPFRIAWNITTTLQSGQLVSLSSNSAEGATSFDPRDMGWLDRVDIPAVDVRHVRVEVGLTEAIVLIDGIEILTVPGEGIDGHIGVGSYLFTSKTDNLCVLPL